METKNILRIERQSVKDIFIQDFTANRTALECYVRTTLHVNWISNKSKIKKINASDYEETLIKFLEQPDKTITKQPLLIIVGGAGSGKSSSIQYALKTANICNGCSIYESCVYSDESEPLFRTK